MPATVNVAAFVFGVVLLLAAIIGREIKIVAVEIPALSGGTRVIIGVLGAILTIAGFLNLSEKLSPSTQIPVAVAPTALVTTPIATSSSPVAATSATLPIEPTQLLNKVNNPIVFDDFTTANGRWQVGTKQNEYGTLIQSIGGGVYTWKMTSNTDAFNNFQYLDTPTLSSFEIQADFKWISGVDSTAYGISFLSNDTDGGYYFLVRSEGAYDLALWDAKSKVLSHPVPYTKIPIDWKRENTIKVSVVGSLIRLYINGSQVANSNIDDDRFRNGRVGLVAVVFGKGNEASFEIRNFQLAEPR